MTDNEIIKALECCKKPLSENTCVECSFYKTGRCSINMLNATLDIINRQKIESNKYRNRVQSQKGEITRLHKKVAELTAELEEQKAEILELQKRIINWRVDMDYRPDEIKSEAIKEFAEKLKENYCFTDRWGKIIPISTVDNLVKEMTEVNDEEKSCY